MKERHWIPGLTLGGLGALLAFALKNDEASLFDAVRLRPVGLILLVMGSLFLLWGFLAWIAEYASYRSPNGTTSAGSRADAIHSVGGLVAVAIGVGAVAALTIVVLTTVANLNSSSAVAVATSAFGVISAVVGAFIGIKIGTDQSGKGVEAGKAAAAALGASTAKLTPDQREAVKQDVKDATDIAGRG